VHSNWGGGALQRGPTLHRTGGRFGCGACRPGARATSCRAHTLAHYPHAVIASTAAAVSRRSASKASGREARRVGIAHHLAGIVTGAALPGGPERLRERVRKPRLVRASPHSIVVTARSTWRIPTSGARSAPRVGIEGLGLGLHRPAEQANRKAASSAPRSAVPPRRDRPPKDGPSPRYAAGWLVAAKERSGCRMSLADIHPNSPRSPMSGS
jgi:hypothetical protein